MKNLAKWKTDSAKEQSGVDVLWANDEETGEPIVFKVARIGGSNREFEKVKEQKLKPHRRNAELGIFLSDDASRNLLIETFVETSLKGWRGIKGENGEEYEFNRENAISLMTEFPDIYEALYMAACNMETFRLTALESEAKN